MKLKLYIAAVCALSCLKIFAQSNSNFTGVYAVKQICKDGLTYDTVQEIEYELEIHSASNDSTDFEINLFVLDTTTKITLGCEFIDSSDFYIPSQVKYLTDSVEVYINSSGSTNIYKDSINFNFFAGFLSPTFSLVCNCNGNKVRDVPLTVKENSVLNNAISLYPNPAKEELKVLWPILSGKSYNNFKIYTVYGQSVLENKSQLFERIDLRGLQAGVYVIQFLKDEVSIASGRFVKIE